MSPSLVEPTEAGSKHAAEPPKYHGSSYRAFIADVYGANGWRLPALLALMGIVAASEGLSITLLLPLMSRIGIATGRNGNAMAMINNVLDALSPGSGIGSILAVILVLAGTQMILFVVQGYWASRLVFRYEASWRTRLFESFLNADWLYLTEKKGGELMSAAVVESGRIGGAFYYFTLLCSTAIACIIYLSLAIVISWKAALMLIGLICVMVLSISRLYRISHSAGEETGALNAKLQVLVSESLSGAKIIKTTGSGHAMAARVEHVAEALERAGRTRLFLPSVVRGLFEFTAFAAFAVFLAYGVGPLGVAPASVIVILALFVRVFPRFTAAQTLVHDLNLHVPAILILRRMLHESQERAERQTGAQDPRDVALPTDLTVSGLRVAYGSNEVLKGVDLSLRVPGMIGIVGGSGAGKSTLVHSLLALLEPSSGTIKLGQNRLAEVSPAAWRRNIGYVPQETIFFHASVAENLALAKPDASRAEIEEAALQANAHDFIMALPRGYDTSIGDQGVLLSGGQRQRLGIARALLSKPTILLLDEPTSALDPRSEIEVMKALDTLRQSVGIVVIAHRLTTVQGADKIFMMEDGKVIESGEWSELITHGKQFHALAKLQQIVA